MQSCDDSESFDGSLYDLLSPAMIPTYRGGDLPS